MLLRLKKNSTIKINDPSDIERIFIYIFHAARILNFCRLWTRHGPLTRAMDFMRMDILTGCNYNWPPLNF